MYQKLIERLREECEDVTTYANLADESERMEDRYLAAKLRAIAYEEFTHAFTLREYLRRMDVDIDEETCRHYRGAKAIVEEL